MAQGRRSAMSLVGLVVVVFGVLELSMATTYTVGDSQGWTFYVANWPDGKTFKAGDVLVFKYDPALHNVVQVNGAGFTTCVIPEHSKTYQTGLDHILLQSGGNFFVSGVSGDCQKGMLIEIYTVDE
ncbi:hypothetical protein AMTRI_Chr04g251270 [Amborella trichopoda]|uniref:Plantacyanin n=1 Tax=Amborella trichopoda TaxID=13333 RepID=W1NG21_AMBTC|nr:basic blue protein-like [Amborella trichopoda]ERM94120.1 hypothetical protein AMTR_s00010p00136250 [Amborella trichopoda]|eukprot:XP_020522286.1 basic blue protein-like [Amborella trichopoda]